MSRLHPRGIEPSASNGHVLTTVGGVTAWAESTPVVIVEELPSPQGAGSSIYALTGPSLWDPSTMLGVDGVHPNLTGHNHLVETYLAALEVAALTPDAGGNVYAYGDSWTASNTYVSAGQKAIDQLATELSLTLANRAVGGSRICDAAQEAIGVQPFVAGTAGLAFIAAGLNDLLSTDTAVVRAAVENHLRAALAVLSAAQRIENTAFTYSPGHWTTSAPNGDFSGGTSSYTTTDGATATITISTPGDYYLLAFATDGSTNGGILSIEQGATLIATADLHEGSSPDNFGPNAVRLPGLTAGTLTVTFDTAGRTSAAGWIDALIRISDTPPTILAVKPVEVLDPSRDKPDLLAHIRDVYDALAEEFGSHVVTCDPAGPLAPTTVWYSDGYAWIPLSEQDPGLALGDLVDVDTEGAADADVLAYDAAADTWLPAANSSASHYEVLMASGVTPPEPLTTSDETDWLYGEVT